MTRIRGAGVVGQARRRWRFQFSVRAALSMLTVTAVCLSWQAQRAFQQVKATECLEELGGKVTATTLRRPEWLWRILGDKWSLDVSEVSFGVTRTDELLPILATLAANLTNVEIIGRCHDREAIKEVDRAVERIRDALPWVTITPIFPTGERLFAEAGPGALDDEVDAQSIARKLRRFVRLDLQGLPIQKALEEIARSAGVSVVIDPEVLATSKNILDKPVFLSLRVQVRLATALELILAPNHLDYHVISEQVVVRYPDVE